MDSDNLKEQAIAAGTTVARFLDPRTRQWDADFGFDEWYEKFETGGHERWCEETDCISAHRWIRRRDSDGPTSRLKRV